MILHIFLGIDVFGGSMRRGGEAGISTYDNSDRPLVGGIHEEFEGADLDDARLGARLPRMRQNMTLVRNTRPKIDVRQRRVGGYLSIRQ
ncbi:MAG: hypothetical protein AAF355_14460 [Myxococcota bacterium]